GLPFGSFSSRTTTRRLTIDAAATSRRAVRVKPRVVVSRRVVVLEEKLPNGRPTRREIKLAAQQQERVAKRFGVEALSVHAPEETIVAVNPRKHWIVLG